jgi:hypothetical protein
MGRNAEEGYFLGNLSFFQTLSLYYGHLVLGGSQSEATFIHLSFQKEMFHPSLKISFPFVCPCVCSCSGKNVKLEEEEKGP